jgi:hypothetical protein
MHSRTRWIARTGAIVAVAGVLSLAVPRISMLAPEAGLPSSVAVGASVRLDKPSAPVRIRIPAAGIDLPVVSSERTVPGNVPSDYPLCDVAQYWTKYDRPGKPGTAWIFAHAQPGMFLPLFTISEGTGGNGLIGASIYLQLRDGRLLTYRINEVKERTSNENIARRGSAGEHRLVLQTSTGPPGTIPKLQVAATLIDAEEATEKAPKPEPRACWQPRSGTTTGNKNGSNNKNGNKVKPTAAPEVIEPEESIDTMTLALGSGAVLLGATFVAVWVVRRQP